MKVMIDLFRGVLPTFQRFAKKLQHEKPMVHLLHVEMVALVRELLSKFIRPKAIPLSHKEILKIDVRRRDFQLPNKRLSVGQFCYIAMNKARVEGKVWVDHIYDSLREGYMRSAEFLLKNLPLDNIIISSLSALTPSLMQSDGVTGAFTTLGEALPNVVPPEEIGQLVEECRAYQLDGDMLLHLQSYTEGDCRVDVDWWTHVASLKKAERDVRYPTLCKLVKALLSIFTGPLVEGSFNLMDDILEDDRCSMNVETYESLAVIKSTLKAKDRTASTMTIDQPLRRACLSSFQNYQLHLQKKKETEQALRQKRLSEAARMQSLKETNKLVQQARKIKRPAKSSSVPVSTSSAQATTSFGQQALKKKLPPKLSSVPVSTSSAQATTSFGQQALKKKLPPKLSSVPVYTSSAQATTSSGQQALKKKLPPKLSSVPVYTSSAQATTSSGQQALKKKLPPKLSSVPVSTSSAQATTSFGQQALKKKLPPKLSSVPVSTSSAQATTSSGQQARTPDKPSSSPASTSGQARCPPFATASASLDRQHIFPPASPTSAPATTSSVSATTSSASATTCSLPTRFFPLFHGQSKASSALPPNMLKRKGSVNPKTCSKRKK
ncbi:uncharacterized protein [Misgurnus anguillicaudatus]|uniref:uncharacterized protein n=1 Tax=Misgurnus anguillicaudatus TaxID=75329 RepID=UPI003CCFDCFC